MLLQHIKSIVQIYNFLLKIRKVGAENRTHPLASTKKKKKKFVKSHLLHRDPFNSAEFWNSFPYAREINAVG